MQTRVLSENGHSHYPSPPAALAFDTGGSHTGDEGSLKAQEEGKHRQRDHRGPQKGIPAPQEGEDGYRRDDGTGVGHDDSPVDLEVAGPIHQRRFIQFDRDALEELVKEEDGEGAGNERNNLQLVRVKPALCEGYAAAKRQIGETVHQQEERDDNRLKRDDERGDNDGQDEFLPFPFQARERESGHAIEEHTQDDSNGGHDDRIHQKTQKRAGGKDRTVVIQG